MLAFELDGMQGAGPTVFIDPEDGRPLTVLNPDATIETCWSLPTAAYELVTRETVYEEIREELEKAKLSKQARAALESLLDRLPG